MKRFIIIATGCICVLLNGCITEYTATGINEVENILVVEGLITEGESTITLSKSTRLTNIPPGAVVYVNDARVYVECDDGTQIQADQINAEPGTPDGKYMLRIDNLHFERKYRLKIQLEEKGINASNQKVEYCSEYMYPNKTPEIDSVFFSKAGYRQPVIIHVATRSKDENLLYFRWSFTEEWEIHSTLSSFDPYIYPYYCWGKTKSQDLLIGSAQQTDAGRLTDRITEVLPASSKLRILYRIRVTQYALSKRAYEYFSNIKKNVQQTGDLFTPIPSELRGNITCTTYPERPVIGYVEISTSTRNQLYLDWSDDVYEYSTPLFSCSGGIPEYRIDALVADGYFTREELVPYLWGYDEQGVFGLLYIRDRCIDCRLFGTTDRPDDWPE